MSLNNMGFAILPENETGIAKHSSCDLEQIFSQCFLEDFATVLIGGWPEPYYLPRGWSLDSLETGDRVRIELSRMDTERVSMLCYRSSFFASALHEVAHWCIAGESRRKQSDFGYWYVPECRDARQQNDFQRVEVRPQALELLFSIACDYPFRASYDNPDLDNGSFGTAKIQQEFTRQILKAGYAYVDEEIPARASHFMMALGEFYGISTDALYLRECIDGYAKYFQLPDSGFGRSP